VADTYNALADQGATWKRTITWKDNAGAAINLTGFTARMELKRNKSDEQEVLTLTSTSGIVLGGAAGTIAITITADQAIELSGEYFYDLRLVNGSEVTYLMQGVINFDAPKVTT